MSVTSSGLSRLRFAASQELRSVLEDDERLARLGRRLGVVVALLLLAFVAFYIYDRYVVVVESPLDQAVAGLEERVRQDPSDPDRRLQVASAYTRQGRYEEAITQYGEAMKLRDNWQPALLGMAATELERKNERRAEEIYRQIADLNRDNELRYANRNLLLVYYRLALFASQAGRHAEAAEWAREALRIDRTEADSHYLLGTSEEALGNVAAAGEAYRKAVSFDPNFREAFAALQRVAAAQGNPREARYARGMELLAAGDANGALAEFQRLVQQAPDYAEAYQGLGLAYGKMGQREESTRAFRMALERNPELLLAKWSIPPAESGR